MPSTLFLATITATNASFTAACDTAPAASGAVGVYQYASASSASRFDNIVLTNTVALEPSALLLLAPGAMGLVGLIAARHCETT